MGQGETATRAACDAELVVQVRSGDRRAFAHFYSRHYAMVFGVCFRRLNDPHLAQDATNATFVKAWQNLASCREPSRVATWLVKVAERQAIDFLHSREDALPLESADRRPAASAESGDTTLAMVLQREETRLLAQALDFLPTRQRDALVGFHLGGETYAHIASRQGVSVGAVKSLLHRTRAALRMTLRYAGWPALALRRRGNAAGSRLNGACATTACQVLAANSAMFVSTVSVAVAALLPLAVPATAREPVATAISSSTLVGAAHGGQPSTEGHGGREWQEAAPGLTSSPVTVPLTRTTLESQPSRHGATAPSQTKLRLEIVSPDGRVLVSDDTGYDCDGAGSNVLPQDGPVREVC